MAVDIRLCRICGSGYFTYSRLGCRLTRSRRVREPAGTSGSVGTAILTDIAVMIHFSTFITLMPLSWTSATKMLTFSTPAARGLLCIHYWSCKTLATLMVDILLTIELALTVLRCGLKIRPVAGCWDGTSNGMVVAAMGDCCWVSDNSAAIQDVSCFMSSDCLDDVAMWSRRACKRTDCAGSSEVSAAP